MAHIQDRGKDVERRWQARYRDPDGKERTKTFRRKADAQRWLDEKSADMLTGRYVDPQAGTITLGEYAERWLAMQTFDASSRETVTSRLMNHIIPQLGDVQLRELHPSMIQTWLRGRQQEIAPRYVGQVLTSLSAILRAAVEDGRIATNPCDAASVKPPKIRKRRIVPWSVERVQAITAAHDERYRGLPALAAGCGLRQGEAFGVRPEDIDFLRRRILVRRQVRLINGRPVFALPKGGREREVPLPEVVSVTVSEGMRKWPSVEVTLPWEDHAGGPVTETLVFTDANADAIVRHNYNRQHWKPALEAVGMSPSRRTGMHQLRHHYASVLLDGGVSIRALAEYLGHSDPGFTLRTYAHMMPASDDRARAAIDNAYRSLAESSRNELDA